MLERYACSQSMTYARRNFLVRVGAARLAGSGLLSRTVTEHGDAYDGQSSQTPKQKSAAGVYDLKEWCTQITVQLRFIDVLVVFASPQRELHRSDQ